ncbi:MAG: hypothetical protein NTX37_03310 [Burkholderiales bacterium]|nr:hypothetical protein [Burkholderiales bacterium]
MDVITRNGNQSGVMLSLEDYQAVQDMAGLCRCRQDREMVERINKLIKEVQSSFGLVSGSQRSRSSAQVRWMTGNGHEQSRGSRAERSPEFVQIAPRNPGSREAQRPTVNRPGFQGG